MRGRYNTHPLVPPEARAGESGSVSVTESTQLLSTAERGFSLFVSMVLGITAAAKVVTLLVEPASLLMSNPIFGLPNGLVVLAAAVVEGHLCWRYLRRPRVIDHLLLAAFALVAVFYRVALFLAGTGQGCNCLGVVGQHLSERMGLGGLLDQGLAVTLMIMLLGSVVFGVKRYHMMPGNARRHEQMDEAH